MHASDTAPTGTAPAVTAPAGTAQVTHQVPQGEPEPDAGPRKSWAVLALALTAQILVVLDISVVNTALPVIGESLRLGSSDLQWLVTAYLLLSGGGLLLGGRIADLVPRHRVFLTGMTIFTGASLFSGFANNAAELITARGTQGLGAALMTPAALSLVMTTYSGAQRTRGLALWGAVGSLGIAAGVLFGGALTTWFGWQLIFWVNVPIGVVALAVGLKVLPKDVTARAGLAQFDLPGAVTVIGGLGALMYGLASTSAHGWLSAQSLAAFAASALLLAAFVRIEKRAVRPLVPPHTWKVRTLVSGTTVMLGATALLVGTVFLTSIFFQTVMGYSALRAGVAFLPLALAITAGTHLASKLLAKTSPRNIAAGGLTLVAAGAVLLSLAGADARFATDLLPGLLVLGFGVGLVFVAVAVTSMAGIPAQHAGMASGFLMTGHEVGAALGVAVLSAVATAAGSLTDAAGVVDGFTAAFIAAAVLAVGFGVAPPPRGGALGRSRPGGYATADQQPGRSRCPTTAGGRQRPDSGPIDPEHVPPEQATAVVPPGAPATPAIPPARAPGCHQHAHCRQQHAPPQTQENKMTANTAPTFVGTETFRVDGMTCDHCRIAVTAEVSAVPGVEAVTVDIEAGTVTVSADQPVDQSDIAAAVDEAGYTLLP